MLRMHTKIYFALSRSGSIIAQLPSNNRNTDIRRIHVLSCIPTIHIQYMNSLLDTSSSSYPPHSTNQPFTYSTYTPGLDLPAEWGYALFVSSRTRGARLRAHVTNSDFDLLELRTDFFTSSCLQRTFRRVRPTGRFSEHPDAQD